MLPAKYAEVPGSRWTVSSLLPSSSLLFDPVRLKAALDRKGGTPFVPTPPGGTGAQRRTRAAAGRDRSRAQPRAAAHRAASMASTARTHPLPAASTGACRGCR